MQIDQNAGKTVHLPYSRAAEQVIRNHLEARYPRAQAQALWEKAGEIYRRFTEDMPDLGGKKNYQAGSVYDCVALFACYEAQPEKPSLEDMALLNRQLFVPERKLPGFLNLNYAWARRVAHMIFSHLAKRGKKYNWPGNYHMEVEPYDPKIGVRYRFTTCPIADFARNHGYGHLMSAFCNPDYPMLERMGGGLIRTETCANGSCCDYWIVGDRSRLYLDHPTVVDREGYVHSELSREERW